MINPRIHVFAVKGSHHDVVQMTHVHVLVARIGDHFAQLGIADDARRRGQYLGALQIERCAVAFGDRLSVASVVFHEKVGIVAEFEQRLARFLFAALRLTLAKSKFVLGPIKAFFMSPFIDQEISLILARLKKEDLGTLGDMMSAGKITPVIDRRYSLVDVTDAIRYSEEGHVRGKLIVEMQ